VTKRIGRGRKGGTVRERRNARTERVRRKREERPSGTKFADASDRRRTAERSGEELRGKGDSPKRSMGLCKRDIKISLQIASTTFPFRSRSAYRIETRETDCLRSVSPLLRGSHRHSFVSILRTFDSTVWKRERFFCNRCVSATANRFNCREYCPRRNDRQDSFVETYVEMFVNRRHPIMLPC